MYLNVYLLNMLFLRNEGRAVIKIAFIHSFNVVEPLAPQSQAVKHTLDLKSSLFHREDKWI